MPEQHTPEPWIVNHSGRTVSGMYAGMLRIISPEPFHSRGTDFPDGGSTKSYTDVVCACSGDSETAIANMGRIVDCVNALAGLDPSAVKDAIDTARDIIKHGEYRFPQMLRRAAKPDAEVPIPLSLLIQLERYLNDSRPTKQGGA